MVVAILGLIYAAIDVLGTTANTLMYTLKLDLGTRDPGLEFCYHDLASGIFTTTAALATVVFTIWLVAGCIGSLRLRPWARMAMVRFGWANLGAMLVLEAVYLTAIMPRMMAQYPPGPQHTMAAVEQVVQGVLMLVPLGLSITILLIYRRPYVQDAFAGKFAAAPRPFPVEPAAPTV